MSNFLNNAKRRYPFMALFGGLMCAVPSAFASEAPRFSLDILPILSANCFECHGPDAHARQADLRLDTRDGALRAENPIIKPGDRQASELIRRLTTADPDERMPPAKTGKALTQAEVEALGAWIDAGAEWGKHWAFEPPVRPEVAAIEFDGFPIRNPIDAIVLAQLRSVGLAPSPEAARETLLRRVSLDLTGLPPTLEEADAFLADTSADAYEKVVDRLLASSRFGERMAWEWLEAARYADTNGYQGDPTRSMYFWRDWVIDAWNSNMPFDRFTIEQIAGDLLPQPEQSQLIATGFHRNHMINGEGGRIAEESRVDYVQDRVETTGTVWLGLTFNCCRCHDHKFDPLTQREYYSLSAYFNSIDETGANDAGGLAHPLLTIATPEESRALELARNHEQETLAALEAIENELRQGMTEWEANLAAPKPDSIAPILEKPSSERSDEERQRLFEFRRDQDAKYQEAKAKRDAAQQERERLAGALPRTMVMRERAEPRETFILTRGLYDKPGEKVSAGVPAALHPLPPQSPANRLALARWLVAPENPLTPRVIVNRFWQTFFGRGLVTTSEDFGTRGDRPRQAELLDWLASEFVSPTFEQPTDVSPNSSNGWNSKRLIRLIVTSSTYRQSSRTPRQMANHDPSDLLLARGPRFRMPSWMIRDQALAIGGLLVEKKGGPPVKGYQPPGVWEDATFGQITYEQDHGEALYRRSLYQFWRRIVGPTVFFDVASRQTCQVKSSRTNTPLHALTTLNDVTYVEAARALAQRVLLEAASSPEARIERAYRLSLARQPNEQETKIMTELLAKLRQRLERDPEAAKRLLSVGESKRDESLDPIEHATYAAMAGVVLNLDETLTKE